MFAQLRTAAVVFVGLTVVTGVAYPLLITVIAQTAFHRQANGSLVEVDGRTVGSELVAQGFTGAAYFWSRPSAAGYNGAASTGSNLGPAKPAQLDAVKKRAEAQRQAEETESPVPIDLVTASGSGLDPHLSPAAAEYQIPRVAKERGMRPETVRKLVADATEGRTFSVLGEPRVNVLRLNLALDVAEKAERPAE